MQFFTQKAYSCPKKCLIAQKYLQQKHQLLYAKIAGCRDSRNIEDVGAIQIKAQIMRINWHEIKDVIFVFTNTDPTMRKKKTIKKRLVSQGSKPHKTFADMLASTGPKVSRKASVS